MGGRELGGDVGGLVGARPDDDGRPGAGERDADRLERRLVAERLQERRRRGAVRLVQAVVERRREQRRVARRRRLRRAARPAPAVTAASSCGTEAGSAARDSAVLVRSFGTTTTAAAGIARRCGRRAGRRFGSRSGRRRRSARRRGCRRGPRAPSRARAARRARGRARRRPRPATSPSAIVAALEPSPRSSGIRFTKRKRRPSSGATSANARSARCDGVARRARPLPPPRARPRTAPVLDDDARSRGRARRRRSRSRARGSRSRRARTAWIMRAPPGSPRASRSTVADDDWSTASVSLSPWPVTIATALCQPLLSTCESAATPAADDGSQKTPSCARELPPPVPDVLLGERDDLQPRPTTTRPPDLVRVRRLGDPDRGRPGGGSLLRLADDEARRHAVLGAALRAPR